MMDKKLLQEYKSKLEKKFHETALLVCAEGLIDKFQKDFEIIGKLPKGLREEVISIVKNRCSTLMSKNNDLKQSLLLYEIIDQREYLKNRFSLSYAKKIQSILSLHFPLDKIEVMSIEEKEILESKWWGMEYEKMILYENYFLNNSDQENNEKIKKLEHLRKDSKLVDFCEKYRKRRNTLMSCEDIMTILTYAKLMPKDRVTAISRAIRIDPNISTSLKEKSYKVDKRIRRVVDFYDKETDNLRT